jgi:hypothetical protein
MASWRTDSSRRATTRGARALAMWAACACTCACDEPAIGVRVVFPSEETFLVSTVATIDVYDGEGTGDTSPDAICRALSVESSEPPQGLASLASSSKRNVCELRGGATVLEGVGVGRRVVFAETQSGNTALLRGCVVVDLFADGAAPAGDDAAAAEELGVRSFVEVPLATLPTYPEDVAIACDGITAKCEEQQACTE